MSLWGFTVIYKLLCRVQHVFSLCRCNKKAWLRRLHITDYNWLVDLVLLPLIVDVTEQKIKPPLALLEIDQVKKIKKSITNKSNEDTAVNLGHLLSRKVNIFDYKTHYRDFAGRHVWSGKCLKAGVKWSWRQGDIKVWMTQMLKSVKMPFRLNRKSF